MRRLVRRLVVACGIGVGAGLLFAVLAGSHPARASATCTIYWTGATNTAWNTTTNWSLTDGGTSAGRIPTSTDFVCMSTAPTRAAVVATSASRSINGISFAVTSTVSPSLTLQGGTFTINSNDSVINSLQVTGTLNGSANLTITGASSANGAVFSGGTKTIDATSSLATPAGLTIGTTTAGGQGALVVNGTLAVNANSSVQLATGPSTGAGSTLTVPGTMTFAGGGSVSQLGTGVLKPALTLTGSMTSSGSSVNSIGVPFTNSGTVGVTGGSLALGAGTVSGSTDTGTYSVASGAKLVLSGGTRTVNAGVVTGAGTLVAGGGTVSFGPSVLLPALTVNGGTVQGSVSVGVLTFTTGTVTGSGTMTVTGTGSTLCSATIAGGYVLLNQGTMSYSATCGGNPYLQTGGTLENAGTLSVAMGAINYFDFPYDDGAASDALLNDSGATFNVSANTSNTTEVDAPFTNNGTVNVTSGTLQLDYGNATGTTDGGTYALSTGTKLVLAGGTRTVNSATVTGGSLVVNGAKVTFGSGVSLPTLTINSGTVQGSPSVGVLNFTGGNVTGSGTMTVTGSGSTICGPSIIGGYRLLNQGSLSYSASCNDYPDFQNGGTLENAGTLTVTNGSTGYPFPYGDGAATNALLNDASATMNFSASPGNPAEVEVPFTDNGTVNVTSGTLQLDFGDTPGTTDGGTFALSSGTKLLLAGGARTVNAGTVTGGGALVVGGGSVSFGAGVSVPTLAINGGTVQGSPTVGVLTFGGGTVTGSGTMTVTGTGSTLCNAVIAGGYVLINQGSMSYSASCGGYVYLQTGGTLENSGTLTVTVGSFGYDAPYSDGAANDALLNDAGATLTVSASGGYETEIGAPFTNNGTVNVTSGTLQLDEGNATGTTDGGTYALSTGTKLAFGGGNRAVSAGTVSGGVLVVNGATVTFGSGVSLPALTVNNGTVQGSPTVGVLNFGGGTATGSGTMTVTGTGSTICGPNIAGGYRLLNQGAMTYSSICGNSPYLQTGGVLENAGSFTVAATNGYSWYDDGSSGNAVLNDAGATLTAALGSGSTTVTINTPVTNNGTIVATKGGLNLPSVTNLSGSGTLTGGIWTVGGGTLQLPRTVAANAATITLGATGTFTTSGTSTSALSALASNPGTLSVGQNVTDGVSLSNTGTLAVVGGTFRASTYAQTAGATTIASGAVLKSGTSGTAAVTINGGVLTGSGTVQGLLSGLGTVMPGTSGSGTLSVTGTYTSSGSSTLSVTAGATSTAVAVSGAVNLGGTLAITTASPAPAAGTAITIVTGASVAGTFSAVAGQDVPAGSGYWVPSYTSTSVVLTFTAYPQVSVTGSSTPEGNSGTTSLPFTVALSGPSARQVTVAYATSDGTATAPGDYTAASGTVTFAPGTTSQTVNVSVNGDTLYEADETLTLTLSAPTSATLGTASATGTIVNDDAPPAVSITDASGSVNSASGTTIQFPVTLSAVSGLDATVTYATSDGTAVAPGDYTSTTGTLTIPAGSTSGTVSVVVPSQPGYTPPKTFTVTLSSPVNATLGTASATGTIVNTNQTGGTPTVSSVSPNVSAQATTAAVTISGTNLSTSSSVAVSGTGVTVSNVTVPSSASITATFTVAVGAATGPRDVTVSAPGLPTVTCSGCFTVTAAPTATALSRTTFARGNVDALVTVTGSAFQSGTTVRLTRTGTTAIDATSVTVNSGTSLTADVSIANSAVAGTWNLVVVNPDGGTATCANCVKIFAAPKITSITPNSLARGSSTSVTITGTGFVAGAIVSIPGTTLTNVVVVSSTKITATVSVRATATPGSVTVKVINPDSAGDGFGTKSAGVTIT